MDRSVSFSRKNDPLCPKVFSLIAMGQTEINHPQREPVVSRFVIGLLVRQAGYFIED